MFGTAPTKLGVQKHISSSSSIYSPIESDFGFKNNRDVIHEETDEAIDDIEPSIPNSHSSSSGGTQYVSYNDLTDFSSKDSNLTYKTYMTAKLNGGSDYFNSSNKISDTIYTANNDDTTGNDEWEDYDATPHLDSSHQFDATPVIGSSGAFDKEFSPESRSDGLSLPQKHMSHKFKRLSITLNKRNLDASDDSHTFLNAFKSTAEKYNGTEQSHGRKSLLYEKIRNSYVDTRSEDERIIHRDTYSIVSSSSSISNRSSVLSLNARSYSNSNDRAHSPSKSVDDFADSMKYRNGSYSSASRQGRNPNEFNMDEEIPTRKDIVQKVDKLVPSSKLHNVDDRLKERLYIEAERKTKVNNSVKASENDSSLSNSLDPRSRSNRLSSHTDQTDSEDASASMRSKSDDLSSLFIRALHSFEASSLQLASDVSICLSFEKDDLAFVHNIDDSGWGEVTLLETLRRGWIPMNYFSTAIQDEEVARDSSTDEQTYSNYVSNGEFLRFLFHSCGKFLLNPLSHETRKGRYTFSVTVVNSIRDGVRTLLQETDCLSRSNEIVTKKDSVRKARKALLADWYNLMVKANEYKGTSNFEKIELLTLMVYHVTNRAVEFLDVWSSEKSSIVQNFKEQKATEIMVGYPLLAEPPMAMKRVFEIHRLLYLYLGLILGRLDIIEHNSVGCEMLENMTHQIILLLRELLFISKTGSDFSASKPKDLDTALDLLLSLVADLVSSVKALVLKTLNESEEDRSISQSSKNGANNKAYYFTEEGGDLIQITSKMFAAIGKTITSIRKLLEVTGDFKLNSERKYPDYSQIKFEPEDFIKKCTEGVIKTHDFKVSPSNNKGHSNNKRSRYSVIRSGRTGALGISEDGSQFLNDVIKTDGKFSSDTELSKYITNTDLNNVESKYDVNNELIIDKNGNLLGASFRGLVYCLTDEDAAPEYFFVSTFFICFRGFANGIDLVEELILRFEVSNFGTSDGKDLSGQVRLKKRRKLIVKMFQIWMESYWSIEQDSFLLTTLVNFFNEGISKHLYLESLNLLEIAARLSCSPLTENDKYLKRVRVDKQLVDRKISLDTSEKKNSIYGSFTESSVSGKHSDIDGYMLNRMNSNRSSIDSVKSVTLPVDLELDRNEIAPIITKKQIAYAESLVLASREYLKQSWSPDLRSRTAPYVPLKFNYILDNWYTICDSNWVVPNSQPILLEFNSLELAKQLTLIESTIFCSITAEELLNENYTSKRAHLKLAPNIRKSLLFTNSLSSYILETILQDGITLKRRISAIKVWLKVGISCLYLRNFNSLAIISTALQSHLISRLTEIWDNLSEKYKELYEYLSSIIHPSKNYNVYRTKLKNFLNSASHITIVPYFSLFLQDLTFVTDGNPNYREANTFLNQKLINIDKYLKITKIIADTQRLQIPYNNSQLDGMNDNKRNITTSTDSLDNRIRDEIVPVPCLQELILLELWKVCQLNKKDSDRAWKLSCKVHPRPRDMTHYQYRTGNWIMEIENFFKK